MTWTHVTRSPTHSAQPEVSSDLLSGKQWLTRTPHSTGIFYCALHSITTTVYYRIRVRISFFFSFVPFFFIEWVVSCASVFEENGVVWSFAHVVRSVAPTKCFVMLQRQQNLSWLTSAVRARACRTRIVVVAGATAAAVVDCYTNDFVSHGRLFRWLGILICVVISFNSVSFSSLPSLSSPSLCSLRLFVVLLIWCDVIFLQFIRGTSLIHSFVFRSCADRRRRRRRSNNNNNNWMPLKLLLNELVPRDGMSVSEVFKLL